MSACDTYNCNDGTCSVVGGVADCSCYNGYVGDNCESHVCDGQTCSGNGDCIVDPNDSASYQCECYDNNGYSGSDCSGRSSSIMYKYLFSIKIELVTFLI